MVDEKQMDLSQWEQAPAEETTVTLEQMDELIVRLRQKRDLYDAAKETASELYKEYEALEAQVIQVLEANRRSNYAVDGVATVSVKTTESYKTPKTNEEKQSLFDYIKNKYGPQALMSMVSINSQTLNSWANKEADSGVMSIPGLQQPTATPTLSLRRK